MNEPKMLCMRNCTITNMNITLGERTSNIPTSNVQIFAFGSLASANPEGAVIPFQNDSVNPRAVVYIAADDVNIWSLDLDDSNNTVVFSTIINNTPHYWSLQNQLIRLMPMRQQATLFTLVRTNMPGETYNIMFNNNMYITTGSDIGNSVKFTLIGTPDIQEAQIFGFIA